MKIDTVQKAFVINALLAAAVSSLIIETRLQWRDPGPKYAKTFVLTFGVNLMMFCVFAVVIGNNSLAKSMFS